MYLQLLARTFSHSRRLSSSSRNSDFSSTITELNKEMESIFGEPPSGGLAGSINDECAGQESQFKSRGLPITDNDELVSQDSLGLSHVGHGGEAQMVDVSPKETTKRTAIASCRVILGKKVFDMVAANQMGKGDVLTVAKIAGISGAKQTSNLIPLCHNIPISHVRVDLRLNARKLSVDIEGEAVSTGKTGVEMEAMSAVTIAGLTVYDMCKAASKHIQITDIQLESKTGGKSGDWLRINNHQYSV